MRTLCFVLVLWVSPAFAQWDQLGAALGMSLVQISGQTSTAASGASSEASSSSGSGRGPECSDSTDCHSSYWCDAGRCVDTWREKAPAVGPTVNCASEADCAAGDVCLDSVCVLAAPSPSSSMRRQVLELYVRARAVELREEFALGRGPVITELAKAEGVSAMKLGRTLRKHRVELAGLIGDASATGWAGRLLTRVEELCTATDRDLYDPHHPRSAGGSADCRRRRARR